MMYEDLLNIPYKVHGRSMTGMDCYGLVLECCRRSGKVLPDFVYCSDKQPHGSFPEYAARTGALACPRKKGAVAEYENQDGTLHVGYMVDEENMLHMTYSGVRLSTVGIFRNVTFYEVPDVS